MSDAYLRMYMIIIISVFQKCKGTEFLAHEDGTQMFCSDDLYFFGLWGFSPPANYLLVLQTFVLKSKMLEK